MQLDSHMRLQPNWDTELIKMLHSCDAGEYSVLTTYVPSFTEKKQDNGEVLGIFINDLIFSRRWFGRDLSNMPLCGGEPIERNLG